MILISKTDTGLLLILADITLSLNQADSSIDSGSLKTSHTRTLQVCETTPALID
jgi:hypothetical protein